MTEPFRFKLPDPPRDKATLRKQLQAERQAMSDRHARSMQLQEVLQVWLLTHKVRTIGAYWAIKGEFDALPALYRWAEAQPDRRMGLPVMNRETKKLSFHVWYPGCPMEEDGFGILKPKDTERFEPELLIVPCVGFGPKGIRLGYGGGFYDRTLAAIEPRPLTAGIGFSHGYIPWLEAEAHDVSLDALITEDGVIWDAKA
jgi:5,10-methenyltetrahydrofolate synthetase